MATLEKDKLRFPSAQQQANLPNPTFIEEDEPQPILTMHPKKFIMWLIIVSIVMIFASLTSAYMVKRGEGNWLQFQLPAVFYLSSVVIVASSITMQLAYWAASKDNFGLLKGSMVLTAVLGLVFTYMQVQGWGEMVDYGVYFGGKTANAAGSFVYVFTGLHIAHLLVAIGFVLYMLISTFQLKVHATRLAGIEICTTFWHFLGGLWIYLFIFLLYNQ